MVPELHDPELREVLVGRYRVLYELHADTVWIMRLSTATGILSSRWDVAPARRLNRQRSNQGLVSDSRVTASAPVLSSSPKRPHRSLPLSC